MTNLTHLSSAHRDQCPRRRWDTRLTPPARRRLAERKQNGAMSRGRVQVCSDSRKTEKNGNSVGMKCKLCSNEAHGDVGSNRKLVGSDHFRCCGIKQHCVCPCGIISPSYFLFSFYLHGCSFFQVCFFIGPHHQRYMAPE